MQHHSFAGGKGPKQRCRMRTASQVTVLYHVLKTVLSDAYDAAAWQGWVEGPIAADATCQITEEQITFTALQQLEASHLQVLLMMHERKAFDADGWNAMQHTMERLKEDASLGANAEGSLLT